MMQNNCHDFHAAIPNISDLFLVGTNQKGAAFTLLLFPLIRENLFLINYFKNVETSLLKVSGCSNIIK